MEDASPAVFDHEEAVQLTKRDCRNGKEVERDESMPLHQALETMAGHTHVNSADVLHSITGMAISARIIIRFRPR